MKKDELAEPFSLRQAVERSMAVYLGDIEEDDEGLVTNLYELVLSEIEPPLIQAVLDHNGGNQSRTSTMLGLNRGTLRKKIRQYGLRV
ncbi:helix-turn-helix domain-containing protein [Pseudohongiella spirulinae]|jgi:Fis family transcriptional regulator, factor for inversion stimulation protein|uniref:Putative Fis-like DNA-binding protein n=1 Tax=Pseudohongiella spirulinae TaxID=1249552 RepID=A0A0S2KAG7_9GAMM|nr:helix-turn-helix domain-containing protein [Pseudohongiella spirulinae]ALO45193.1 Fis family transcriptional regulator [Pseudohongiella spirulinae]